MITISQARVLTKARMLREGLHLKTPTEDSLKALNEAKANEELAWSNYWDERIKQMHATKNEHQKQ